MGIFPAACCIYQRIIPRWQAKLEAARTTAHREGGRTGRASDREVGERLSTERDRLKAQEQWLEETIIEIIVSEAQNEVADFKKWGFDIIPHRERMKQGFEVGDKRLDVETAFKNPQHPFRIAIVCAMWLTGFDVECLSTLYSTNR